MNEKAIWNGQEVYILKQMSILVGKLQEIKNTSKKEEMNETLDKIQYFYNTMKKINNEINYNELAMLENIEELKNRTDSTLKLQNI